MKFSRFLVWSFLIMAAPAPAPAPAQAPRNPYGEFYKRSIPDLSDIFKSKIVVMIAMRDGVKLYTEIYVPRGKKGPLPIILERSPYTGHHPEAEYTERLALYTEFFEEGFIFAFHDLRGVHRSEGEHILLRRHVHRRRLPPQRRLPAQLRAGCGARGYCEA